MRIKPVLAAVLTGIALLGKPVVFAQQRGPIDLILLLDTSASMSGRYREVNSYLTGSFLRGNLRLGDTFHLIAFSDKPRMEIARRIEGRGDLETIIGRMLLMYPLEPSPDLPAALLFAEDYAQTLGSPRPKKIVLLSQGGGTASFETLAAETRSRLGRQNISFEYTDPRSLPAAPEQVRPTTPAAPSQAQQQPTAPAAPGQARPTTPAAPSQAQQQPATPAAPSQARPAAPATPSQVQQQPATPSETQQQRPTAPAAPSQTRPTAPAAPSQAQQQPTAPVAPGQARPTTPVAPSQTRPTTPAAPSQTQQQPATPTTPSQAQQRPTTPAAPSQTRPTTPTAPSQPQQRPTAPTTPGQAQQRPTAPSAPSSQAQQQPAAPTTPAQTARPTTSTTPSQTRPTTLVAPSQARPTTPSAPSQAQQRPTTPTTPAIPSQTQQRPTTPTAPGQAQQQSATPAAPGQAQQRPTTPPTAPSQAAEVSDRATGESLQIGREFLLAVPILLVLGLLGLGIFLVRRVRRSPHRPAGGAARPSRNQTRPPQKAGNNTPSPKSEKPRPIQPRRESPYEDTYRPPKKIEYGPPLMLKLYVADQSTLIGKRNTHLVKPGLSYTIGGGNSDFLIFLVRVPPHIGELRYQNLTCSFYPRRPEYFPDLGSEPIHDCIGKTIRVISDKGYELSLRLEQYEDPLVELNRILHSIRLPSTPKA